MDVKVVVDGTLPLENKKVKQNWESKSSYNGGQQLSPDDAQAEKGTVFSDQYWLNIRWISFKSEVFVRASCKRIRALWANRLSPPINLS